MLAGNPITETKPLLGFRAASIMFAGLSGVVMIGSPNASAAERYAAIVMDAQSGEVLDSRHADDSRYPASITKVMTLYLLFDALDRGDLGLKSRIAISRHAARAQPSKLGIRAGQTISVDEAIRAIVVKSANDVAIAVAEKLAGSEAAFAQRMTKKAVALGMSNTHFANASGLPNPHNVTTAHDLALLGQAMIRNHPDYYPYFSTAAFRYHRAVVPTHNNLLGVVDGVDGLKTGYTAASGYNLLTSAMRGGRRLIFVVMGGASSHARDYHMAQLVEAGFLAARALSTQPPEIAYAAFKAIPDLDSGVAPLQAAALARLDRPVSADVIGVSASDLAAAGDADGEDGESVRSFKAADASDSDRSAPNAAAASATASHQDDSEGEGDRADAAPRDSLADLRADAQSPKDPYADFGVF